MHIHHSKVCTPRLCNCVCLPQHQGQPTAIFGHRAHQIRFRHCSYTMFAVCIEYALQVPWLVVCSPATLTIVILATLPRPRPPLSALCLHYSAIVARMNFCCCTISMLVTMYIVIASNASEWLKSQYSQIIANVYSSRV